MRLILVTLMLCLLGCGGNSSPDNNNGNDNPNGEIQDTSGALKIAASCYPPKEAEKDWRVEGYTLVDGKPKQVDYVYAVVTLRNEPNGNRVYLGPADTADADPGKAGKFTIGGIPASLASLSTGELGTHRVITIIAGKEPMEMGEPMGKETALTAKMVLELGATYARPELASGIVVLLTIIGSLFVLGVGWGLLFRPGDPKPLRWKYSASVVLAFAFAIIIVIAFAAMLYEFRPDDASGARNTTSLGFATIYEGQYSRDLPSGLIFSLTEPPPAGENQTLGFAAPLWVLLLSVIGTGLITITLVVGEIASPPPFDDVTSQDAEVAKKAMQSIRNRIKRFVENQTFLLASPFVGIFVYQAVREGAGAETQVLAVAIAALGAGPTLNLLLKKGEQAAKFGIERAAGRIPSADEQPPVPPSEQ
jgi:hypothetical protein